MNQIITGQESRDKLKAGVDKLANAVKVTLGARGKNVIIKKEGFNTVITKDGASIARDIVLDDPIENIGAEMARNVAQKTNDVSGDGTTTATVLTQAIISEGYAAIEKGISLSDLKKGIDLATEKVIAELKKLSKKATNRKIQLQIGRVSANGDKDIAKIIVDTITKVGREGVVTIEESNGNTTVVDFVEGMNFDNGYLSPYFQNNFEKALCELDNPFILLYNDHIENIMDILDICSIAVNKNRPLLIIAEDIDPTTLSTLVANFRNQQLRAVAVKAPGYGDRRQNNLEDIAVLTGGKVISKEDGSSLKDVTEDMLGECSKITIAKENTTIVGGAGDKNKIKERQVQLKAQIQNTEEGHEKNNQKQRLAKLSGGVAVIKVGGYSAVEIKEKYDRYEDAYHAVRNAIESGYLAGGGTAYLHAAKVLAGDAENEAVNVLKRAIEYPYLQILKNAEIENKLDIDVYGMGYNVVTEKIVNLFDEGIIDPTKIAVNALQNASSIATAFLSTECIVYNSEAFM